MVACCVPPAGDLANNPGVCPEWESNLRPFGLQVGAQSTEAHQPGLSILISNKMLFDPHKQTLFGILNIFAECKGVPSTFTYTILLRHEA